MKLIILLLCRVYSCLTYLTLTLRHRRTRFRNVQGRVKVGEALVTGEGEAAEAEVGVEGVGGVVHPLRQSPDHRVLSLEHEPRAPRDELLYLLERSQELQRGSNPKCVAGVAGLVGSAAESFLNKKRVFSFQSDIDGILNQPVACSRTTCIIAGIDVVREYCRVFVRGPGLRPRNMWTLREPLAEVPVKKRSHIPSP